MNTYNAKKADRKPCGTPQINRDFVQQYFGSFRGSEAEVRCPIHGERNASMRINIDKGVFYCHGCGAKGTLTKLAKALGVPYAGSGESGTDLAMFYSKIDQLNRGSRSKKPTILSEEFLQRFSFPTTYWQDQGFTDDTITVFDLGFDMMTDAATIPVRTPDGSLLGVTRRFLKPALDEPKYKDPKGFVKAENLFGSWLYVEDNSPYCVLTEGPKDCMKVWQSGHPSMAQFGSHCTPHQIRLMRMFGIVTVILFYDNDNAGRKATREALGWTHELRGSTSVPVYDPERDLSRFFIVKEVAYNSKAKDPGELSDRAIDRMVRTAQYARIPQT